MDKRLVPPSSPHASHHHAQLIAEALNGANCLIALKDLQHRYLYANPELEALYGAPRGTLVGTSLDTYVSIKYALEMHAREQHVIREGAPAHFFERLVIRGRPHTWETLRFPLRDADGKMTGSGIIAIDVDESVPLTSAQQEILQRANEASSQENTRATQNSKPTFLQLHWHTFYECGNPTIDRQHLALFEQANELLNAVLSNPSNEASRECMRRLMEAVIQHFHDEESILRQVGYPHVKAHQVAHQQLLENARALAKQVEANHVVLEDLFRFLAQDVIAHHLLEADRDFFAFIDRHFPVDP